MAQREPGADAERPAERPGLRGARRQPAQRGERHEGGDDHGGLEPEQRGRRGEGDDHAAERRADRAGQVDRHAVERDRTDEQLARHHLGHEGLEARHGHGERGAEPGGEREHRADRGRVARGQRDERDEHDERRGQHGDQQPPPVGDVGERAREQREQEGGEADRRLDERELGGRAAERPDHRDGRDRLHPDHRLGGEEDRPDPAEERRAQRSPGGHARQRMPGTGPRGSRTSGGRPMLHP